jgi:hypothetical protein
MYAYTRMQNTHTHTWRSFSVTTNAVLDVFSRGCVSDVLSREGRSFPGLFRVCLGFMVEGLGLRA